jgi:hypothetical protein
MKMIITRKIICISDLIYLYNMIVPYGTIVSDVGNRNRNFINVVILLNTSIVPIGTTF